MSVSGDGGPATAATLCKPGNLLATADGRLIVSDQRNWRIRQNHTGRHDQHDRAHRTPILPPFPTIPTGLAQLPDGDILISEYGRIRRLTADDQLQPFLPLAPLVPSTDQSELPMMDFVGSPNARTRRSGRHTRRRNIDRRRRRVLPRAHPEDERTLVAIRDARIKRGGLAVGVDATREARATLNVRLRGRTVARATRVIGPGRSTLRINGHFKPRRAIYGIRVTLDGPNGATAHDHVPLYLASQFGTAFVKGAARSLNSEMGLRFCRRFGARRVDCVDGTRTFCETVVSLTLRRTGVIWKRYYDCETPENAFQRHPKGREAASPVPPGLVELLRQARYG